MLQSRRTVQAHVRHVPTVFLWSSRGMGEQQLTAKALLLEHML